MPVGVPIGASAPRTAAAGGSPRRPRGASASAQLAVHCRRPARLRSTTPQLCGSCAAALVARRRSPARGSAHTPAATTCGRGPRARYWAQTRERRSERTNWPLLTRSTGRGLAVAWSSTHAAGQKFGRAARRSGTSWRGPLSAGNVPAVGPSHGLYGGYATRRAEHLAKTPDERSTTTGAHQKVSVLKWVPRPQWPGQAVLAWPRRGQPSLSQTSLMKRVRCGMQWLSHLIQWWLSSGAGTYWSRRKTRGSPPHGTQMTIDTALESSRSGDYGFVG